MKPPAAFWSLLFFAAATHFLVDAVAGTLNPLWPRLGDDFQMAGWQSLTIFVVWQLSTSVSQFVFGIIGERLNTRWLLWAGPLTAVLCLGSIGLTTSPLVLGILTAVGGLAIAAFHPEGATLAGSCAPHARSRAMSVFAVGGFIGQAIGPIYSGQIVEHRGLPGLAWGIPIGLAISALLVPLSLAASRPQVHPRTAPANLEVVLRGLRGPIFLVLIVGSLRIIAASGVPVLIGFLLKSRGAETGEIGLVQSAFMTGIGLGGLACAALLRPHHEGPILWLCPLLVTPVLLVLPWTSGLALTLLVCLSGLLLGISLPVLISLGQQLMPGSPRIASSITMGVSWGIGGGIVSLILAACESLHRFEPAFIAFAVATAFSSFLCIWLPTKMTPVTASYPLRN